MLTLIKMKHLFVAVGLLLSLAPSSAFAGCNPLNPICLFKMMLKATPGLPVFDFTSVPAIIPHVPAALLKEGQVKMKEVADNALEKIRSGQLPSMADIKLNMPAVGGLTPAEGQEYSSLEGFPNMDSEDPLAISKAIEVIFLRPGWNDKNSAMTQYDRQLMAYYQNQFKYNNVLEVTAFTAIMQGKVDELMTAAEDIQKQIDSADDLNKAQRANYSAHLMEYQLTILYNQLLAASLQMDAANNLAGMKFTLNEPIFGNM